MLRALAHIVLGVTLIVSSAGVFVSKHYCKNQLKDWSLYAKAEPCHTGVSCPMHATVPDKGESKGCCDDQSSFVKSDQDQVCMFSDMDQEVGQEWTPALAIESDRIKSTTDRKSLKFFNHKPPLIIVDPAPLLQVFRL